MTEPKVSLTNASVDQEQFLTILSREEAIARFEAALFPRDMSANDRALTDALGLALASDVFAVVDVPPFDRSNVDDLLYVPPISLPRVRHRRFTCG